MSTDPRIVAELRAMFLTGATPSRLARHVAARHEGDPDWPARVEAYFAEAFGVTAFVADATSDRVGLSEPDADLLRDMVGRAGGWRESAGAEPGTAWCDGLSVAPDDLTMHDRIRPGSESALADSWGVLSLRAREFVRRAMTNAQGYYERAQVLARLVECLQQRVEELERREEEVRT